MKRDIMGEATQRAMKRIAAVRARMAQNVPYGPTRSFLSKPEQRKKLQHMDPNAKIAMIQQMGDEEWGKLMEQLYNGN